MASNDYRNVQKGGRAKLREKQDNDVTVRRDDLRIVLEELWQAVLLRAVQADEKSPAQTNLLKNKLAHSTHLLSGLMLCGICGGPMVADKMSTGSGSTRRTIAVYCCSNYRKLGSEACSNSLRKSADTMETCVLDAASQMLLTEEAVDELVRRTMVVMQADHDPGEETRDRLKAELSALDRKMENLWKLAAESGALPGLGDQIQAREARRSSLEIELQALMPTQGLNKATLSKLEALIREKPGSFKTLLLAEVGEARKVLREVFAGRTLQCRPVIDGKRKGYELSIELGVSQLVTTTMMNMASPRGFEPRLSP